MNRTLRKFLVYSLPLMALLSCSVTAPAVRIKQTPQHLTVPSPKLPTLSDARAVDGCAFSGTWKLDFSDLVKAGIEGWIVFDVLPGKDDEGRDISKIRAVIEWGLYEQDVLGVMREYASFYVYSPEIQPVRSFGSDAYLLLNDGDFSKVPVRFDLDPDGLSMDFRYYSPAYSTWVSGRAEKFRASNCGEMEPYIDEVKGGMQVKSGASLPPASS